MVLVLRHEAAGTVIIEKEQLFTHLALGLHNCDAPLPVPLSTLNENEEALYFSPVLSFEMSIKTHHI